MILTLWQKFKTWNELRRINKWYNWELVEHQWRIVYETPTHKYEELMSLYVNIITGEKEWRNSYHSRDSRHRDKSKSRITLK